MLSEFYNFVFNSNMLATGFGFLISSQVISVVNALFDHIVAPVINYVMYKYFYPRLKHININDF